MRNLAYFQSLENKTTISFLEMAAGVCDSEYCDGCPQLKI